MDLAVGTATGEGSDTIAPIVLVGGVEGSAHDDRLLGSEEIDWITASGGDDFIAGRGGDDLIYADEPTRKLPLKPLRVPGDDVVEGGDGNDQVEGGYGTDVLRGGPGRDNLKVAESEKGTQVYGGAGRDALGTWSFLAAGGATFIGDAGADTFFPSIGSSADKAVVRGGAGRDRLVPSASLRAAPHRSRVVIDARVGTVRVKVGTGVRFSSITSFGFEGSTSTRITWHGSRRPEVFHDTEHDGPIHAVGGGGNDTLIGGWGPDVLDGGPGRDRLDGDRGRDRCLRGERLKSCEVRR